MEVVEQRMELGGNGRRLQRPQRLWATIISSEAMEGDSTEPHMEIKEEALCNGLIEDPRAYRQMAPEMINHKHCGHELGVNNKPSNSSLAR
ncbi:hypothetical protein EJ110_NYTH13778 [Nymphaea thermarum]|nr:hypothetical protein EJ110_NYTH13778 [Nymphaea thermarum]